jgi:hypothetical protein
MRKAGVREEGHESPPSLRRPMKWDGKSRRSKNTCSETGLLQSARLGPTLRALKARRARAGCSPALRCPEGTAREDVGPKTQRRSWARLHRMS